jgi:NADPH:quinone reductase-like Zn-dependent oxidoreductase
MKTEAWVLHEGEAGRPGELRQEQIVLRAMQPDDLLVEPLYGCWEGNMAHAVERRPIDICQARGEPWAVLGNGGVVRVLEVGDQVTSARPGQIGMLYALGVGDCYEYPEQIYAYDAPGTVGVLARRIVLSDRQFLAIPDPTAHGLEQWAGFGIRYLTAWSNWWVAYKCFRAQITENELPILDVWGWGGGTSLAELDLARRCGARTVMLSGSDDNLATIRSMGIDAVDRRAFPRLAFDPDRYASDPSFRSEYLESERAFLRVVRDRTGGAGASIFLDYIGVPVTRATLKALSRQGVITTAGWKHGMQLLTNRAIECTARHIHVHTHGTRRPEAIAAVAYAEQNGWVPPPVDRVYGYDEVPDLIADYAEGRTGYFPLFRVND